MIRNPIYGKIKNVPNHQPVIHIDKPFQIPPCGNEHGLLWPIINFSHVNYKLQGLWFMAISRPKGSVATRGLEQAYRSLRHGNWRLGAHQEPNGCAGCALRPVEQGEAPAESIGIYGRLVVHINFKYLLKIISPLVGWCLIGTFTNPCSFHPSQSFCQRDFAVLNRKLQRLFGPPNPFPTAPTDQQRPRTFASTGWKKPRNWCGNSQASAAFSEKSLTWTVDCHHFALQEPVTIGQHPHPLSWVQGFLCCQLSVQTWGPALPLEVIWVCLQIGDVPHKYIGIGKLRETDKIKHHVWCCMQENGRALVCHNQRLCLPTLMVVHGLCFVEEFKISKSLYRCRVLPQASGIRSTFPGAWTFPMNLPGPQAVWAHQLPGMIRQAVSTWSWSCCLTLRTFLSPQINDLFWRNPVMFNLSKHEQQSERTT